VKKLCCKSTIDAVPMKAAFFWTRSIAFTITPGAIFQHRHILREKFQ
jgi:hypothetical protein